MYYIVLWEKTEKQFFLKEVLYFDEYTQVALQVVDLYIKYQADTNLPEKSAPSQWNIFN